MFSNTGKKSKPSDDEKKKCKMITCIHYAGGYCVGCENECEFIEKEYIQD